MSLGYNRPLYLLPFDHRHSYVTGMFHASPPLTTDQRQAVIDSKRVIYDGFRQALVRYNPEADAALNKRQTARLTQLSDYCRRAGQKFMFELLVPATDSQKDRALKESVSYDREIRPALGRAADDAKVANWLEIAASVPGFIGFAVGRTTFWNAIADLIANKSTREEAVSRIAQRYGEWASIFERAHVA